MKQLHEFTWDTTESGSQVDLRITQTPDGKYRFSNLKDQSQTFECDSRDEAVEHLSNMIREDRSSRR